MDATATLPRGGNFSFTKWNPFVKQLEIVFNWKVMRGNSDLVPHVLPLVIPCDDQGKALHPKSVIFANQLALNDTSAIRYRGDAPSDGGDSVVLDLAQMPSGVRRVFFILLVNPDVRVSTTFDTVRNLGVDVFNRDGQKVLSYDLEPDEGNGKPAVEVCEIYRFREEWKFRANSTAFVKLEQVQEKFGVEF